MRVPAVDHLVRIVLFWRERGAPERRVTPWAVTVRVVIRMGLVYRYRWTRTETLHRDGQQQLGLGECQVRSGEGRCATCISSAQLTVS